jgi:hypothetical protein
VLTRLATEPSALAAVAAEALEIMHFKRPAGRTAVAQGSARRGIGRRRPAPLRSRLLQMPAFLLQPARPRAHRPSGQGGGWPGAGHAVSPDAVRSQAGHARARPSSTAPSWLARQAARWSMPGWPCRAAWLPQARPRPAHHRIGAAPAPTSSTTNQIWQWSSSTAPTTGLNVADSRGERAAACIGRVPGQSPAHRDEAHSSSRQAMIPFQP